MFEILFPFKYILPFLFSFTVPTPTQTNNVNETPVTQGTKLSKRIKPKVNLKNNPSARSSNNNKTTLKPPDTGQNEQNANESNVKTPNESVAPEKHLSPLDTLENNTKNEDNMRLTDEKVPKALEKEPAEKVSEPIEKDEKDDTSLSSSRKLSKRLKVGPKLSSSRPTSTKKEVSTTETSELNRLSSTVDEEESNSAKTESENISAGSKLQKRKKVMPNLKIPSKIDANELSTTNDNCSTKKENTTIIPHNESVETDNKLEKSEIKNNTSSSSSSDQARKTKHVHFESNGDVIENNNAESSGNKLSTPTTATKSPEKTEIQPEKASEPSPNSKQSPSILKKDHINDNNYSSQSEGEATATHTSLGKGKKVFKPNLGARRRKRLSSFSAYSSCDDEDAGDAAKSKPIVDKV